ncbi:unnamed protein product [Dicrocoelium dendriticum]|nr:unnamed protein product [Dicrocoelium dendriticum]
MTGNHSIAIRSDLTVWVTDVNYFEELGRLLSETSFSDLQDYVSFCILNKYAPYAYSESGNLKQKYLKPLAESIGMQHVEGWPYLLDIASPGFKLLILQRWNWKHLERSTQAPLKNVSVLLTQWPYFATDSGVPSYIKFGPMWYSFGKTMTDAILTEHFRQMSSTKPLAWLEETVKAMDLNGINPNISKLLARYLSQDEQLSFLNGHRIYSSFLALELAGRIYLKHMDRTDSSADAHLLKANLPRAISFYVWLFQSICEGNKQQLTSFQRNTNNGLIDECRAAQAAALISPAFHKIIGCADLRFPTTTDDQTSLLKQGVGSRTFYPPTKMLD